MMEGDIHISVSVRSDVYGPENIGDIYFRAN